MYDGLTEYHPETAQPIPALAERWEPNTDNSEFTFHLRDAKWSNGDPITAHDFVYSLRRGLAPAFAARTAYLAYYIKGAQAYNEGKGKAEDVGVDAIDDRTVKFTLAQPVPFFPGLVAHQFFRPVPRKAIEAYGQAWTQPETHRHQRRLHAADLEAVRQARLRPQSALLGRGERQARVDHVLSDRRRDDDDESVQGGRDRRRCTTTFRRPRGSIICAARKITWTSRSARSTTTC